MSEAIVERVPSFYPWIEDDLAPDGLNEALLCVQLDITKPSDLSRIVAVQQHNNNYSIILLEEAQQHKPKRSAKDKVLLAVLTETSFKNVVSELGTRGVVLRPMGSTKDGMPTVRNAANATPI